jgi:hypothetical protein
MPDLNNVKSALLSVKKGLPTLIFLAFSARLVVYGAQIGDAIALISFVSILGFFAYLNKNKVSDLEVLRKDIDDLRNSLQSIKLAQGMVTRKVGGSSGEQKQPGRYF